MLVLLLQFICFVVNFIIGLCNGAVQIHIYIKSFVLHCVLCSLRSFQTAIIPNKRRKKLSKMMIIIHNFCVNDAKSLFHQLKIWCRNDHCCFSLWSRNFVYALWLWGIKKYHSNAPSGESCFFPKWKRKNNFLFCIKM